MVYGKLLTIIQPDSHTVYNCFYESYTFCYQLRSGRSWVSVGSCFCSCCSWDFCFFGLGNIILFIQKIHNHFFRIFNNLAFQKNSYFQKSLKFKKNHIFKKYILSKNHAFKKHSDFQKNPFLLEMKFSKDSKGQILLTSRLGVCKTWFNLLLKILPFALDFGFSTDCPVIAEAFAVFGLG